MKTAGGAVGLFLLLLVSTDVLYAQNLPGGFREVSVQDPGVQAAAKFAVEAQGKTEKLTLEMILKAEAQVVAGRNYRLVLKVREKGIDKTAEATVWAKLDKTFELSRWTWRGNDAALRDDGKKFPGKISQWNGFVRHDFQVDGANVIVVEPKSPLPGKPWVWRGEFFDSFPNADIELAKQGWHLAYIGVPNLFGSPKAMTKWEKFHETLVKEHGLHPKPALIGISRGALYCMAWAALHPEKTLLVYLDNGVCDFKSWPGGKTKVKEMTGPGSPKEWVNLLNAFDFKNDEEAFAYKKNPIDHLEPLAKAKLPILLVYGDSDKAVPHLENSEIIYERYRAMGGQVERMVKVGGDHHPHGLPDPRPIVEYFERTWKARRDAR